MKITLLQPVQNRLYDFASPARCIPVDGARGLQAEMIEKTFKLLMQVERSDLIVTTEAVNFPGLPDRVDGDLRQLIDDSLLARFAFEARRTHSYLVAGLYTLRDGTLYNSAAVFDREGERIALYDKVHLAGDEQRFLRAGKNYCSIDADFGRFGVCVCWDMQFPEVCRELVISGAQLVICPTWGWERIYAHARAYENGVFVAGAMSVPFGVPIEGLRSPSEVVSPEGAVLASGPCDRAALVQCEINLNDAEPFRALRMGDRRPNTYKTIGEVH